MKNSLLHRVYLGLGTNLGDREEIIRKAVALIGERVGQVVRQSSVIETEPWGFESANKFLNAVICCETTLTPRQLLETTQQIERDMGRTKKSNHSPLNAQCPPSNAQRSPFNAQRSPFNVHRSTYTDRPIDIDILLYDDLTVDEPDLKIPHPLMYQRDFVKIPLAEIKPDNDTPT